VTRRRHPASVTADRLGTAVEKWGDQFTPEELDMVGVLIDRLDQISEKASRATRHPSEGLSHD
jgi:hypothetical protein